MFWIKNTINKIQIGQWILFAVCVLTGAAAFLIGIPDNIPGIALLVVSIASAFGIWVWNWRYPRKFWILLGAALLSFPLGVVLHNLFYALGIGASEFKFVAGAFGVLEVVFFVIAVLITGPAALTGLIGGIITSWKGIGGIAEINRSYRRFIQSREISDREMLNFIKLARLSASGANLQPLKYILSNTEEKNQKIFPNLSWAGYLKEWSGPVEGEKPSAYIIMLGDTTLANSFQYDAGIAGQSILLGAAERGLGGCLIGSIKKDSLREALSIPESYEILLVIALGKPGEKVVIEDLTPEGDIKYWRDESDIHHVPKRGLEELILDF
ncbi:MAG: nitroreductase family protein [Anaerolineales bacterium]